VSRGGKRAGAGRPIGSGTKPAEEKRSVRVVVNLTRLEADGLDATRTGDEARSQAARRLILASCKTL